MKRAKAKSTIRILNTPAIAERLRLTSRRIQQLVAEGLPRESRGRYDVDKVLDWYVARLERKLAGNEDDDNGISYNKQRARDRAAAADLKEIKLAIQRRELVSIADVEKSMTDLVVATKSAIRAVPGRIALSLVGADAGAIREKLDAELEAALAKLAAGTGAKAASA